MWRTVYVMNEHGDHCEEFEMVPHLGVVIVRKDDKGDVYATMAALP